MRNLLLLNEELPLEEKNLELILYRMRRIGDIINLPDVFITDLLFENQKPIFG